MRQFCLFHIRNDDGEAREEVDENSTAIIRNNIESMPFSICVRRKFVYAHHVNCHSC